MRAYRALAGIVVLLLAGACGDGSRQPFEVRAVASTTTTTVTVPATTTTSVARQTVARASRHAVAPRVARGVDEATRQRVIAAIYSYSDWDAARMVRVASCESGLSPWAVNGRHHGILQIANATLGLIEEHIALGHQIWLRQGYGAWECKG